MEGHVVDLGLRQEHGQLALDRNEIGVAEESPRYDSDRDAKAEIARLRRLMREASERLDFERAADLRDKAKKLEQQELGLGG